MSGRLRCSPELIRVGLDLAPPAPPILIRALAITVLASQPHTPVPPPGVFLPLLQGCAPSQSSLLKPQPGCSGSVQGWTRNRSERTPAPSCEIRSLVPASVAHWMSTEAVVGKVCHFQRSFWQVDNPDHLILLP